MELTFENVSRMAADAEQRRARRMDRWRELSRMLLPSHGDFPGEDKDNLRNERLANPAGARALRKAAAGMTAGMTPAGLPWFRHVPRTAEMREADGARQWADAVDEALHGICSEGGFYPAIHSFNLELLCFGCALLLVEEDHRSVARFECPTVGTWALSLGHCGSPEFVCRRVSFPAASLPRRFDRAALSERVRRMEERGSFEPVEFVQAVLRRPDGEAEALQSDRLPWASLWWEKGGRGFVSEGGYGEMPFFFTAWHSCRGVYGTGPGDEALPDQRALEMCEAYKARGLELATDPPLLIPAGAGEVSTAPGARNLLLNASAAEMVKPLFTVNWAATIPHLQEEIRTLTRRLEESLMASVFAAVGMESRPAQMSATEYMARRREAVQQMGPALASYEPNVLSRMLERVYSLAVRAGRMPLPPENLAQMGAFELSHEYLGPLSQALRQSGSESTLSFLEAVGSIARVAPQVVDKVDADQAVDEIANGLAAPGSVLRSDERTAQLRQDRAEAEVKKQMLAAQIQGAQGMPGGMGN